MELAQEELAPAIMSVAPFSPSYDCTVITDRNIADKSIAWQINRNEKGLSYLCPCLLCVGCKACELSSDTADDVVSACNCCTIIGSILMSVSRSCFCCSCKVWLLSATLLATYND